MMAKKPKRPVNGRSRLRLRPRYDMPTVPDAQPPYEYDWLERIENPLLREYCQGLYDQLEAELADAGAVSMMRQMLLRRLTYMARMCERLESVMDQLEDRLSRRFTRADDMRLDETMSFYDQHVKHMAQLVKTLLRSSPATGAGKMPRGRSTVTFEIPEEE